MINNHKYFTSPGIASDHKGSAFPPEMCRGYSSCIICLLRSFTCLSPSFQNRLETEGKGNRKQNIEAITLNANERNWS